MKIAILQLARIGDIYQTAPAINAYKRLYPEDSIDLIVRHRFSEACDGLKNIDQVIELPTKHILKPLVSNNADIPSSLGHLEGWLMDLASQGYQKVINLSFSPLSSWITYFLQKASQDTLEVVGYTRTTDGFLAIPDDMSAYVYAQCGPGYPNRFHLNEIFGTLLGVDLIPEDWKAVELNPYVLPFSGDYIAVQVSASQEHKSIPTEKLIQTLNTLKKLISLPIVLLGSASDSKVAETVTSSSSYPQLFDFTGKTSLLETMAIIKQATLFIGPDSSLQNIASLVGTKTLLLSLGHVNFFETGPRALGSFILSQPEATLLEPSSVVKTIVSLLAGTTPTSNGYVMTDMIPCYRFNGSDTHVFQWDLINYIYRGLEAPSQFSPQFELALQKLNDVNTFAIEILEQIIAGAAVEDKIQFIQQADEIINAIEKLNEDITPIIRWYKTEKLRIGPGDQHQILTSTIEVHRLLSLLCTALLEHCDTARLDSDIAKEGPL